MPRPDFWPSPQQELLLIAALAEGNLALSAWRDWQTRVTFETADQGSLRLMPLVYFNLAHTGLNDRSMTYLKQTYIRTRYANKLRLTRLAGLLKLLESQEVPTLLLKGAALALQIYRDPGLRPMADLDVAVPHRCAERAIGILERNGWSLKILQLGKRINPELIAEMTFYAADGAQLDLHFSPFHFPLPAFADERLSWAMVAPFWAAATPLRVDDANTLTLSATDHLLHTLAHGARANTMPPVRWVADAIWLLRGESQIEWDHFVAQATTLQLALVASRTLAYLRDKHRASVPSEVLNMLRRRPPPFEVLEYALRRGLFPRWLAVANSLAWYVKQHQGRDFLALIVGFPNYLQAHWSARNLIEVAWIALKKFLFVDR